MKTILIFIAMCIVALNLVSAESMTLVSGTDTQYRDGNDWEDAAVLSWLHPSWMTFINVSEASWIWRTDGVSASEAQFGSNVTFKHEFYLPRCSKEFNGTITITTDNAFRLRLDSTYIAEDTNWDNVFVYDLSSLLKPGHHTLVIDAENFAWDTTDPKVNPAGVIYRVDIDYEKYDCGDESEILLPEVPLSPAQVPEFGLIAGTIALVGALGIFLYKRK